MKERPILFSAPMVRAILNGQKTQTRRTKGLDHVNANPDEWSAASPEDWANGLAHNGCNYGRKIIAEDIQQKADQMRGKGRSFFRHKGSGQMVSLACPYGCPSDKLWVKETTIKVEDHGYVGPVYVASEDGQACLNCGLAPSPDDMTEVEPWELKLRPSIFMPKSMARIWLEIVSVRVERLNDISEQDALEEGITYNDIPNNGLDPARARTWFRGLWESINNPGSWSENPFVWVIEFRRARP